MPGKKKNIIEAAIEVAGVEVYDPAWEPVAGAPCALAGTYDGHSYRLQIKAPEVPGATGIVLDEDAAQALARWLGREAAADYGRQRAGAQWNPGNPDPAVSGEVPS